jgi:7,8-dihydropterin-6-yl-methyl-4-(beta-D-ribofuranosyl)aminobenzene 5'-phosphate synthase
MSIRLRPDRARAVNGLILSHGHRDHYGGLAGFVAHYRGRMRDDLCACLRAGRRPFARNGSARATKSLPRGEHSTERHSRLPKSKRFTASALMGSMARSTSGNIARQSFERVLPNTLVEPTPADHFTEAERRGRLVPGRHPDEHATCYVVRGRGLVVISSCSHCGLINAIRQAMAVSGVDKLHAVLGGFHLGVAPPDYVEHTIGS